MRIEKKDISKYSYYMERYQLASLQAKVLASLALSEEEIQDALYDHTNTNQFDLSFLDSVITRLTQAKTNHEKIIVCGDYDCDGICATTILVDALQRFGIECGYYIPNRFKEGYGISKDTVALAKEKDYDIIFTVDNGVKATAVLEYAKSEGIDVILSDHHQYNEEDICANYFLHPNVFPSMYKGMCGAGVAFLISKRLLGDYPKHTMLACVATIGDMVPLRKANRYLVKEGIRLLNTSSYMALQLLQNDNKQWDATKVAFQVVPKINCIGRMADEANPNMMVKYLMLENDALIQNTLQSINQLNTKRRELSDTMSQVAKSLVNRDDPFLIIYDESFHEGLNGIVANKLMNEFQKPVMVLSKQEDILKGSIRSNGVDLSTFFNDINEHLISYGGHKEAAGIAFTIDEYETIYTYVQEKMAHETIETIVSVIDVDKSELTYQNVLSLNVLEPFGCGFEMPYFHIVDEVKPTLLSKGKHIKYNGDTISYLYFNQGDRYAQDSKKSRFGFIGKVEASNYFGKKSVNMIVDYIED